MPEIQLPDLQGVGDGLMGGLGAGGFLDMPDLSKTTSLFGSEESVGNDFLGRVYHLKYNRNRGPASMDEDSFRVILQDYVLSGWDDEILAKYYQLPKKLYAKHFMVPVMPSTLCTDAFGGRDLESYYIFVVYKGKLVFPEDIRFRFWGVGDAYIFVHVDGKEVLLNAWRFHKPWFNWWEGKAPQHLSYLLGNQNMAVGDWIELKANEPVDMNVLFGEWKGGQMSGMLLVEVEGQEYPKSHWNGPLLPAFKTEEMTWDDLTEIYKYLSVNECALTNGPLFNDFGPRKVRTADAPAEKNPGADTAGSKPDDAPVMRPWRLADGRTLTAKFGQMLFGKVLLEDESGNEIKLSLDQFSEEDQAFVRLQVPPKLNIEFSPLSEQRTFPATYGGGAPVGAVIYSFTTHIKQTSSKKDPYGYPLTVESFAIGQEIGGEKRILLDRRTSEFVLSEENGFSFSFQGGNAELLDYNTETGRRGARYDGYLVVVRDINGRIIAHKTSSKGLFTNIENLSRLKVGWYFDDDCLKTLPTPPEHMSPRLWDRNRKI
jgi:hypothetical protein